MMRLSEAVASLESLDSDATMYAAVPWTAASRAVVACVGAVGVWSAWRDGRIPSADDRFQAVIHYAVNDSYLQPA